MHRSETTYLSLRMLHLPGRSRSAGPRCIFHRRSDRQQYPLRGHLWAHYYRRGFGGWSAGIDRRWWPCDSRPPELCRGRSVRCVGRPCCCRPQECCRALRVHKRHDRGALQPVGDGEPDAQRDGHCHGQSQFRVKRIVNDEFEWQRIAKLFGKPDGKRKRVAERVIKSNSVLKH